MNDIEKYEIALRLAIGASSGFQFLEDYLDNNQKTDIIFIRPIHILLSYSFELLLKSRVVMLGMFSNKEEINKKLTDLSHDLIKISKEIGGTELLKLGIQEIIKDDVQYIIKTNNKIRICVENFVDIRYDYIFGKNRIISHNEYKKIIKNINNLFNMLTKVKTLNEKQLVKTKK